MYNVHLYTGTKVNFIYQGQTKKKKIMARK